MMGIKNSELELPQALEFVQEFIHANLSKNRVARGWWKLCSGLFSRVETGKGRALKLASRTKAFTGFSSLMFSAFASGDTTTHTETRQNTNGVAPTFVLRKSR